MQELTARTLRRFLTKILKLCNFRFEIQSFYSKNCKFADEKLKTNEFLACTRPRKLLSMSGFTARILRRLRMRILKLFNFRFKICCWTIRIGHRQLSAPLEKRSARYANFLRVLDPRGWFTKVYYNLRAEKCEFLKIVRFKPKSFIEQHFWDMLTLKM